MDFTRDVVPSTIQERIEVAQKHRLKAEDHINGKYNQKPPLLDYCFNNAVVLCEQFSEDSASVVCGGHAQFIQEAKRRTNDEITSAEKMKEVWIAHYWVLTNHDGCEYHIDLASPKLAPPQVYKNLPEEYYIWDDSLQLGQKEYKNKINCLKLCKVCGDSIDCMYCGTSPTNHETNECSEKLYKCNGCGAELRD